MHSNNQNEVWCWRLPVSRDDDADHSRFGLLQRSVKFSRDSHSAAFDSTCLLGFDHTIRFWEAPTGLCHRTIQYADSVRHDAELSAAQLLADARPLSCLRSSSLFSHTLSLPP